MTPTTSLRSTIFSCQKSYESVPMSGLRRCRFATGDSLSAMYLKPEANQHATTLYTELFASASHDTTFSCNTLLSPLDKKKSRRAELGGGVVAGHGGSRRGTGRWGRGGRGGLPVPGKEVRVSCLGGRQGVNPGSCEKVREETSTRTGGRAGCRGEGKRRGGSRADPLEIGGGAGN